MRTPLILSTALLAGALACSAQDGTAPPESAELAVAARGHASAAATPAANQHFSAHLSGREEVPPVPTRAQGQARLRLSDDGLELRFSINVANINNINQSHIHLAPRGVNGPVVAWLRPEGPPPELIPGRFQGPFAEGIITASDLVGPLAGQPLSALIDAMEAGNTYINVHTLQFPPGEIRGQIRQQGP